MSNPIHRSILLDHKQIVDGVTFHEYKELKNVWAEDGIKMTQLFHLRGIGEETYTVIQNMVEGDIKEETTQRIGEFQE